MGLMWDQFKECLPFVMMVINFMIPVLSFYAVFRIIKLVITRNDTTYEVKYRIWQALVGFIGKTIEFYLGRAIPNMIIVSATKATFFEYSRISDSEYEHRLIFLILDIIVAIPFAILEFKAYKERKEG